MNVSVDSVTELNNKVLHLIVIGGTSGIGLALATRYLSDGWQVSIVGSDENKISQLNHSLVADYPKNCFLYQCDVTDFEKGLAYLLSQLTNQPFDQLIYCAGWYLNERKHTLNQADSEKMLAINLQAFQQVFLWASEQLKNNQAITVSNLTSSDTSIANKKLVCLASVAGILDYPDASLYAKCKKAMIATSQAYRAGLKPFGIDVICIASGYVDTEKLRMLNGGDARHKPHIISEAEAIQEIQYAITHDIELHCFPKAMRRITSVLSMLPKSLLNKIMTWQYRKQDSMHSNNNSQ